MKKLFLITAFLCLFVSANSQQKIEIIHSGMTNLTQVIEVKGVSAPDIYKRLQNYIQKNFAKPNKVSRGNIENEFLSFNGVKTFATNQYDRKILDYFVSIDVKDEKIRVTFDKLSEFIEVANVTNDWVTINGSAYFDTNGNVLKKFTANKEYKESVVNSILNDLVNATKESRSKDW